MGVSPWIVSQLTHAMPFCQHIHRNTPLHAFLELVIALVDERKYTELDPQTMSVDFQKKYNFPLPYHPMQTVIQLGIDEKYFEYNSSLRKVYPIWSAINSEKFVNLLHQKMMNIIISYRILTYSCKTSIVCILLKKIFLIRFKHLYNVMA